MRKIMEEYKINRIETEREKKLRNSMTPQDNLIALNIIREYVGSEMESLMSNTRTDEPYAGFVDRLLHIYYMMWAFAYGTSATQRALKERCDG